MKYLKSFNESLINEDEIRRLCGYHKIEHYTINEDGTIDVDGNVDLAEEGLIKLPPLKFRNVVGNFACWGNQLTSLEFCPESVGGGFYCYDNQLTSLEHSPQSVGGSFNCSINQLTSLEFCPESVGDGFYCYNNQLTSLRYIPKRINGELDCQNNKIKNIDYLPHHKTLDIIDNPISKILNLFNYDKDLMFEFNEREIIQKDILIIDRLVEFLEDIGKPLTKEYLYNLLEKEYEIR